VNYIVYGSNRCPLDQKKITFKDLLKGGVAREGIEQIIQYHLDRQEPLYQNPFLLRFRREFRSMTPISQYEVRSRQILEVKEKGCQIPVTVLKISLIAFAFFLKSSFSSQNTLIEITDEKLLALASINALVALVFFIMSNYFVRKRVEFLDALDGYGVQTAQILSVIFISETLSLPCMTAAFYLMTGSDISLSSHVKNPIVYKYQDVFENIRGTSVLLKVKGVALEALTTICFSRIIKLSHRKGVEDMFLVIAIPLSFAFIATYILCINQLIDLKLQKYRLI
jgi:hypothetical protein